MIYIYIYIWIDQTTNVYFWGVSENGGFSQDSRPAISMGKNGLFPRQSHMFFMGERTHGGLDRLP